MLRYKIGSVYKWFQFCMEMIRSQEACERTFAFHFDIWSIELSQDSVARLAYVLPLNLLNL